MDGFVEAWTDGDGDYGIRCLIKPQVKGASVVVIEENGEEIRRESMTGTESGALVWATHLRDVFAAHIKQKTQDEWHRRGQADRLSARRKVR